MRRCIAALILLGGMLTMSGCITALDLEEANKAGQPIPADVTKLMVAKGMTPADPVLIRLFKQESELEVWKRDRSGRYALLKVYPICRWSGQLGPKTKASDRQAPEGFYRVTKAMLNPVSEYYLSFNIGYPNRLETALGYEGDSIMVHGACSSAGCFALTDGQMAEIYPIVRDALNGGQEAFQVEIFPFRMTAKNMIAHRSDPNFAFWQNLKQGYDIFDVTHREPSVQACGRKYVFDTQFDAAATIDPLAACPPGTATVDPAVVARQVAYEGALRVAMQKPDAPAATLYSDGSMNESFKEILRNRGPQKLAALTSMTKVPVSRPKAALSKPQAVAVR